MVTCLRHDWFWQQNRAGTGRDQTDWPSNNHTDWAQMKWSRWRLSWDANCTGWRRQWGLAEALLSTRLFHNCWGSSPQSTLFLGVRAQWVRHGQTALQLVIREGITISFVRKYSGKGERGRTEAALRVPLLSFSFNRVGSLPALEPLGWPSAGKAASPTVVDSLSAKHSFPPFRASLIWYTDRLLPGWQTL